MSVIQVHGCYVACVMCVLVNVSFGSSVQDDVGSGSSRRDAPSNAESPGIPSFGEIRTPDRRLVGSILSSVAHLDSDAYLRSFWPQRLQRSKRATESDQVYVCNDGGSGPDWSCTCSGCEASTVECCSSSIDAQLLNETVTVTLYKNETTDMMTSGLEQTIKESVARSLEGFCHTFPLDCIGIYLENVPGTSSSGNSSSFSPERVVLTGITHTPAADTSRPALLSVSLFVLNTAPSVSARSLPAKTLQKLLLNQSQALEEGMGLGVKSVKVADPAVSEAAIEFPLGSVIAGGVLGAFLVICCVVSAVKAVRDRRLIKARNAIRRDLRQKRRKALQESFRKSPLREKPSLDRAENGEVVMVAGNGASNVAVTPTPTPQTIEVVVHSDYNSQSEPSYSNSQHASRENLRNIGPETGDSCDVTLPNGHVVETGSNGKVVPDLSKNGGSHVSLSHIPDTKSDSVTNIGDTARSEPNKEGDLGGEPPTYWDTVKQQNGETTTTSTTNPPGVDNPAYALE